MNPLLRIVFILAMLINTSCTVVLPNGAMVGQDEYARRWCQEFALPRPPGPPDIDRERINDDDYIKDQLYASVAEHREWVKETQRRWSMACDRF